MQNDFKNFDLEGLLQKLPIKKTNEDRAKRRQLWNAIDMNGNGYVSLAEFGRCPRRIKFTPYFFSQKSTN